MKELAVVVQNSNRNVTGLQTIDAIKKLDLKMYLFNGMMIKGGMHKSKLTMPKN